MRYYLFMILVFVLFLVGCSSRDVVQDDDVVEVVESEEVLLLRRLSGFFAETFCQDNYASFDGYPGRSADYKSYSEINELYDLTREEALSYNELLIGNELYEQFFHEKVEEVCPGLFDIYMASRS
ncbi:hypothetical protein KO361_05835 [Candidatus Woesearchaeota archaeon]|nr:hypothetical protein [Candidatus Woesearchaeota archaeon]